MRNVKDKFIQLIEKLNYAQIRINNKQVPLAKLVPWMKSNMPEVIAQLEPLGWDINDRTTWLETIFISTVLKWYGNNIIVFITDSFLDYQLSKTVYNSPIMPKFWEFFNIQAQVSVLVDNTMFIESDNLDDIYMNIDWKKRHSCIDLSGYDDEDVLLPHLARKWHFLESEVDENGNYEEWSIFNMIQVK